MQHLPTAGDQSQDVLLLPLLLCCVRAVLARCVSRVNIALSNTSQQQEAAQKAASSIAAQQQAASTAIAVARNQQGGAAAASMPVCLPASRGAL